MEGKKIKNSHLNVLAGNFGIGPERLLYDKSLKKTQISNGRKEREPTILSFYREYLKKVAEIWSFQQRPRNRRERKLTEKQVWGFSLETQEKLQTSCCCSVS